MSAYGLAGRVPIYVDHSEGDAPAILIIHDVGYVADLSQFVGDHSVVLPHLRGHGRSGSVAGGTFTLADYAADTLRTLRLSERRCIVAGLGRGAIVAAAATAADPALALALVLAPGDARIACSTEPAEARARWIEAVLVDGTIAPPPSLAWPEPLHPGQRDEIWRDVPRPVGWVGAPTGAWTEGAPADVVVHTTGDLWADTLAVATQLTAQS